MGLKPRFTSDQIDAELERRRVKIEQVITRSMNVLGIKAINHARTNRGYRDQTGNLVNSTGFLLLKDGLQISDNFKKTGQGTEISEVDGEQVGRSLALQIASEFSQFKGWVLIVVAGMEYAASVEYLHGKNVLAATELFLRIEMPKTIESIRNSVNRMKV